MRVPQLLVVSSIFLASILVAGLVITGQASDSGVPDNYNDPIPANLTLNHSYNGTAFTGDIIYDIIGGVDYSGLAKVAYEPNVIRSVQPIYGALPPWTYDAYDISYTIAICVDINWDPDNARLMIGLLNTTTQWLTAIGVDGGSFSGWCPSTEGYDQFVVINWYKWGVYIAYVGNLTKIYW